MDKGLFSDRVALVTGASSGIGRAVALALARGGAAVGVNYCQNREGAESAVAEIQAQGGDAEAIRADVSRADEVQAMVDGVLKRFGGRLDILINNAGRWMDKTPIAECPEEVWDEMMNVNLKGVFLCCRAAISAMTTQKSGVIVNISSVASYTGGGGGTVPYGTSKAGVNTLTRGLARELAPLGIRVNGVAPGVIDTPMQHKHSTPEEIQGFARFVPLGRVGEPEDMVGAVLLLASPQSGYITGEIIEANGGLLMH